MLGRAEGHELGGWDGCSVGRAVGIPLFIVGMNVDLGEGIGVGGFVSFAVGSGVGKKDGYGTGAIDG